MGAAAIGNDKVIRVKIDEATIQSSVSRANSILGTLGQGAGANLVALDAQMTGLGRTAASVGAAVHAANDNIHGIAGATDHASGGILSMIGHLGTMTLALAGVGFLVEGIHELAEAFIATSDHATEVTARIMSFTHSAKDAADAQAQIVAIANQTRSSLPEVAELFSKIGIQADHLGLSLNQVGLATKVFSETSKLSGSTTQQQKGAMLQLGEALDIGTLNGRHFIAMMQDNIVFMRLLATSMGTSVGHLKELSTQGKVTSDELTKALTDPKMVEQIEKQFGRLPVSFGDVRTGIHNTLIQLAGDFATGSGINTSLAVLYANIVKFATDAKPTFEKIGVAFKAAFSTFAPIASAAIAAISPFFSFILDNAPTLIQLTKVGVEAWIAYRIALTAVKAVELASFFMTQAKSLTLLMQAANGGGVAMNVLRAGFEAAAQGVGVLTAAIAANPIGAIVVGLTVVIGLLYEFRDSIGLGGDTMASFGDLMRAVWESVGPYVQQAVDWVSSAFTSIGSTISSVMDDVAGWFGVTFSGFDFSIAGAIRGAALFADFLNGSMKTVWETIKTIWNNFPSFLQMIFASAANLAIEKVEGLVNATIAGINKMITTANGLGAHISTIGDVKLGKVDTGNFKEQLSAATQGAFGHVSQDGAESLLARAAKIGADRQKVTGKPTDPASTTPKPDGDDGSGKKDKKAEERAKKEREFWQTLQNEVETSKLFGIEQQKATEENKLQKILLRDLNTAEKTRVDTMVEEIAQSKAITDLKKATFEAANQYNVESQRTIGLTESQKAVEDEIFKYRISALNAGASINTADYKTAEAALKIQLSKNQALADQNKMLKDAVDFGKKYSASFAQAFDTKDANKARDDFLKAFASGNLKDALGNPISEATKNGILKGFDDAQALLALKPLELIAKFSPVANAKLQSSNAQLDHTANLAAIAADTSLSKVERERAIKDEAIYYRGEMTKANDYVAGQFIDDFSKGITDLATLFGGKFGDALKKLSTGLEALKTNADPNSGLNNLANMFGESFSSGFGKSMSSMADIPGALKDMSKSSKDLLANFSKGGDALAGIGQAVGGALQGSQIGGAVGSAGEALGIKNFSKGAQIGGALGGLTGNPLIALGASIVGGIISSIFTKPDHSNATFTQDASGNLAVGNVTGNNAQMKSAASGAAGDVITGLQSIASQLGGTLSGVPNLTIGTWNDKYRVLDNQQTTRDLHSNNFKTGLHDFGDDEAAAVKYAISEALQQGVISGLSDLAQKALKALSPDSAVTFVQQWTSVLDDFNSMTDPVTSAVKAIIDPLATLRTTMVQVGASTEDLNKIDQYRSLKLAEALKSQLSSITDFQKALNGDGSGVTKFAQLQADQAEFADYKTKIASGDSSINQADYTALGQELLGLARDVFGTSTTEFQSIRADLTSTTQSLADNVTAAFNAAAGTAPSTTATTDPTTAAIQAQTAAFTANQTIQNDYLAQIAASLANLGSYADVPMIATYNGKVMGPVY